MRKVHKTRASRANPEDTSSKACRSEPAGGAPSGVYTVRLENDEAVGFVRPAALPGAEILFAHQNTHHWRWFHERYAVCTCETAAADWRYRGRSNSLSDGTCMLLEPGEVHSTFLVNKPSNFQVLFLAPEFITQVATELGLAGNPHLRVAQNNNPEFFRAYQQLYAAVTNEGTVLEQQSRLAVCTRLLLKHYAERRPPPLSLAGQQRAVERAKAHLQDRFNEPVSLDELTAVAGLSRFHLLRAFARHAGLPPHAYQIHVRIERSRHLLQAGMSPGTVAFAVGFADQSHFTRHFRRITLTTPGYYARMTFGDLQKRFRPPAGAGATD
jgi:AraC-like DNA-binding protein